MRTVPLLMASAVGAYASAAETNATGTGGDEVPQTISRPLVVLLTLIVVFVVMLIGLIYYMYCHKNKVDVLTPRSPRGEDGYNKVDVVTHDPAKPTKDEKKKKDKGKSAPAALAPLVSPSGEPLPAPAEATPVPTGYVVACRERAIEVGLQVSASFNNLDECKAGGGGVEIHELTTAYISKQCEESHLLEMLDLVDTKTRTLDKAAHDAMLEAYKAQLIFLSGRLMHIASQDLGKDKLKKEVDALVEECVARQTPDEGNDGSMMVVARTYALVAAISAELQEDTGKRKSKKSTRKALEKCVKQAEKKKKSKLEELLGGYDKVEADVRQLVGDGGSADELRATWQKVDLNGNNKVTRYEVDSFVSRTWGALMAVPRANKEAFKVTCQQGDGDDVVEKAEFPSLLSNLVYFNKLYFVFSEVNTNNDRVVSREEFGGLLKMAGVKNVDADAEFAKADTSGNGSLLFPELCRYVGSRECPVLQQIEG